MKLRDNIKDRILILDGAMGTMIQGYNLTEKDFRGNLELLQMLNYQGNNDMLNLSRPDIIEDIHRRYLEVGADIISTNTFSAQRISQADYHMESFSRDIAFAGAKLARKCADEYSTADKPRFVAGSIGPTNKTCSMSPDVSDPAKRDLTYDALFDAYSEQVAAMIEGGIDAVLIETIFDTLNAKVAIDASLSEMKKAGIDLPIMLSVTITDLSGRTLSGQTLDAFLASVSSYPIFSVGLNCSFGAEQMRPYLKELAAKAPYYISIHPNAGLPNSMGEYDETAEIMVPQMASFVDEGLVNIIGGCCGTTEEFIAGYVKVVEGKKPHIPVDAPKEMILSGLEQFRLTPEISFVNVGERCNVAGSRKFLRLVKEKNYEEALTIARKQVDDGALVLDINMDDGLLEAKDEMAHFVNMISSEPEIARVPLMIDSSDWEVVVSALKCVQGKAIVNSISLKEGEEVFIRHAKDVLRFGAAVVVMCFDEEGQATSYERRIEIAERAYKILTEKVGFPPQNIIFDPNILAICTGMKEHNSYAVDFIRATKWIKKNLPGAHVSGGVSNLSFSFRGNNYIREAMHAVFLYHAIQVGMDFGIVNPATKVTYADIPEDHLKIIEDVVLDRVEGADELLIELANKILEEKEAQKNGGATQKVAQEAWRNDILEDRLKYALRKGISTYLNEDIHEALEKYPHAVNIIEGPLMQGMNEVGDLFGAGKMFLPQVVKTARTMKDAVAILQPYIEKEKVDGKAIAGKVLLATVKGDVHDIGKNIVGVVMACNNYEVIDLGVMVPADQIIKKAKEENVDLIGLSGLITPSLQEMVNSVVAFKEAGLNIPVMIGGATTSQLHVALKIAPLYDAPVVWVKDASVNPSIAAALLNEKERERFCKELDATYEKLRAGYKEEQQKVLSLSKARENKLNLFD
ncbi:methionine synthase [Prevotella melaninogenica]|uniref:methionine synthase n=1 Tax=Prevotella melaninogenica TaxID=28132 RepID=UPI0001AE9D75|nr:methionine synthase [Prevotella melaninogenica]ADK96944.1 5-methyltetrahydrofolate--homocysteine methyltransferase [Prevotella melaninogenica ATCC 25845]ASE18644.1 methionine synthase [Prevotella melaninogenica]UEB08841.1 methionine synthase [Prevotella melaninogenica]